MAEPPPPGPRPVPSAPAHERLAERTPSHRFFLPPEAVEGETVAFSTGQARQLARVLRMRPGDLVRVFDGVQAADRVVRLSRLSATAAEGVVVGDLPRAPEPRVRLLAYPALLPRDKFEQVLQKLVEVGVAEITPVVTARALARVEPDAARLARWREIAREAAEQAGRGVVPTVRPALPFDAAVAEATGLGPSLLAYEGTGAASPRATLAALDRPARVSLFVGPEGGFEPAEVQTARQRAAHVVTLGPRILRTETASPVFAALVLFALGDLDADPAPAPTTD